MITYYSKLKRKLILGAVLVVVGLFILILLTRSVSAVEYGNPLTNEEIITNGPTGLIKMKFTAKIDFTTEWRKDIWDSCVQMPFYVGPAWPYGTWTGGSDDFEEILGYDYSFFIKLETLEYMDDYDTCTSTESYFADQNYEVYLLPIGAYRPFDPYFETYQDILDELRNINTENDVDMDSVFEIIEKYESVQYYSYLDFTPEAQLEIIYPPDNSFITSNFEMEVEYEDADGYDRLMVIFEDWNASSTCPEPTDFSYWVERSAYYNDQSMPYFSDRLSTSTGTTTFSVYGLGLGKYNCNKCYFVNDITGAISDNLCKGYDIEVAIYVLAPDIPQFYLPFSSWEIYYAENSDRYETSTPLFNNLAWTFDPLITNIGNIVIFFNNFFDKETASEKGAEFGNVIPVFRGYLDQFNDFFGGLPISELLLFFLITAVLVIVYRIVKGILTIIIP